MRYLLLLLSMTLTLHAATLELTLRESLNRAWGQERVSWDLSFAAGACHRGSLMVTDADGQPVPHQLSHVRSEEDERFVRSGRVSLLVPELAPLSTRVYTLRYGPEAQEAQPPTATLASLDGQTFTLDSGEARLTGTASSSATDPTAAAELAPPFDALHLAGRPVLHAELYGDQRIVERRVELVENGPVFAIVRVGYTYADRSLLAIDMEVTAGSPVVRFTATAPGTFPASGWRLVSAPEARPDQAHIVWGAREDAAERTVELKAQEEPHVWLTPWAGDTWWRDHATIYRLSYPERPEDLVVSVHDVDKWVRPEERPSWAHFNQWDFSTIPVIWDGWQSQRAPLTAAEQAVTLSLPHDAGTRIFSIGMTTEESAVYERMRRRRMGGQSPLPSLEEVQRMVLQWPDSETSHPKLLLNAEELAAAAERLPNVAEVLTDPGPMRGILARLGDMDLMRHTMMTAARYDAVIDSGKLSEEERRIARAQMAYIAYINADPRHWSLERGYISGNPNMSVSRITNIGVTGLLLRNHPMSETWTQYAVGWVSWWLDNVVAEGGGWPESAHYARVSWSEIVLFALMAKEGGAHDFFTNPTFRKTAEFYEQTLTPIDPLRLVSSKYSFLAEPRPSRVNAPYGRGVRGDIWGISGLLAKGYADVDPAFARELQWSYTQSGLNWHLGHSTQGLATLYVDPTPSEQAAPQWRSRFFPSIGYLLRQPASGERGEDYLLFTSQYYQCPDGQLWPADTGSIAKWFSNGVPLGGNFRRIPETSSLPLVNRVWLAQPWDGKDRAAFESGYYTETRHDAFASLTGSLDYVNTHFTVPEIKDHHMRIAADFPALPERQASADAPFEWRRQILVDHGTQTLLIRDTVPTDKPTQWQFWFLSEKLGTPADAGDREGFLADAPGYKILPARALSGDQFVAFGQFGMDVDCYVAAPSGTPRHTMRYGTKGSAYGARNFQEFQDSLQLQREGAGDYFVVLRPRAPEQPPATFTTLAGGVGVRIDTPAASLPTWCFLAPEAVEVETDRVAFRGSAGTISGTGTLRTLSLGAAGRLAIDGVVLEADAPVSLRVNLEQPDELEVTPGRQAAGTATITLPGQAPRTIDLSSQAK